MANRRFRLNRATLQPGVAYVSLEFSSFMECNQMSLVDPVIAEVCGEEMDYGRLFAYCFRRFGYPNRGWDDHKELTKYILTTPHPQMYLSVVPYVGNTTSLTFRFLVPSSVQADIDAYARQARTRWEARCLDWAEQQGLPAWMPEWLALCNTEIRAAFQREAEFSSWRETLPWMFAFGAPGTATHTVGTQAYAYREQLRKDYEQVEPFPEYYDRPAARSAWNDDDPLKEYAEAAVVALRDLHSAVGVRDQAINAFGAVENDRADVRAANVAGYAIGALGNEAPEELIQLHQLINKLGKGNAKRGLSKALKALEAAGLR